MPGGELRDEKAWGGTGVATWFGYVGIEDDSCTAGKDLMLVEAGDGVVAEEKKEGLMP